MRMTTTSAISLGAIAAALALFIVAMSSGPLASAQDTNVTYTVEIENLTDSQPFTPPLIAAHTAEIDVFTVGEAASEGVKEIAENGNLSVLSGVLDESSAVIDTATGDAPVMPGASASFTLDAPAGSLISWVSMLICTNDGFTGIDSRVLQASGTESVETNAYDAGTEMNTEDFADIVPPCQALVGVSSEDEGTGESNPDLAEGGVIAAHAGIQGGTDLTVEDHGWTDPVARVTITAAEAPTATPASAPNTGGTPADGDGASLPIVAGFLGIALIVVSGSMVVLSRRTTR